MVAKKGLKEKKHTATVVAGVEGMALYIDNHRVSGPKPWGGGVIRHVFTFTDKDLREASVLPSTHDGDGKLYDAYNHAAEVHDKATSDSVSEEKKE